MTFSQIMKSAHKIAKEVRNTVSSYREALSVGMKRAYASVKEKIMTGSEKQVKWANEIIKEAQSNYIEYIERKECSAKSNKKIASRLEIVKHNLSLIEELVDASFIINNRCVIGSIRAKLIITRPNILGFK